MLARSKQQFIDYFNEIDDPRQDEKVLYPLHEVLFLVLVGVLGCAEDWEAIIVFGEAKLNILRIYFPYEHGLPSISTLMRVMGLIDKSYMESWLNHHAQQIVGSLKGELRDFFILENYVQMIFLGGYKRGGECIFAGLPIYL